EADRWLAQRVRAWGSRRGIASSATPVPRPQCTPRARRDRPCSALLLEWFRESFATIPLCRERRAAAAGALGVRVVELEARSVEAYDVVDLGVLEVLEAHRIDVELHAVRLELLVHVAALVLEVEVVGEPGAPSTDHAQSQPLPGEGLGLGDFANLGGGLLGDRDHVTRHYRFEAAGLPLLVAGTRAPARSPPPPPPSPAPTRGSAPPTSPLTSTTAPDRHATTKAPGPRGAIPAAPELAGTPPGPPPGTAPARAHVSLWSSTVAPPPPAPATAPASPDNVAKTSRPAGSTRRAEVGGSASGGGAPPSSRAAAG